MAAIGLEPTSPIFERLLHLEGEIHKITSGAKLTETEALSDAKDLRSLARGLKAEILSGMCHEDDAFARDLAQRPIPFSTAQKVMELLSSSSIQFEDKLKRRLSETVCIFWEIVSFQTTTKDNSRRVYARDVEKLAMQTKDLLSTLPKFEVEMRFALKRCQAVSTRLDPGEGKAKRVIKDFAPDFTKAALVAILSRNPSSLVSPVVDLSIRVYREIEAQWYRHTWALTWGKAVTTREAFDHLVTHIANDDNKSKTYFCLIEVIYQIFKQSEDPELKEHMITDGGLLSLAEKIPEPSLLKKWSKDKYWKVRCYSLKVIGKILKKDPSYLDQSTSVIEYITTDAGTSTQMTELSTLDIIRRRLFDKNKYVCLAAHGALVSAAEARVRSLEGIDVPTEDDILREATDAEAAEAAARAEIGEQDHLPPPRTPHAGGSGASSSASGEPTLTPQQKLDHAIEKQELCAIQLENRRLLAELSKKLSDKATSSSAASSSSGA